MSEKAAFVTGVAGFIGRHVADALLRNEYRVVGIDNLSCGEIENVPKGVEFVRADCSRIDDYVDKVLVNSIFFHCAAIAGEGYSVVSPRKVISNNVVGTVSVIEVAIKRSAKSFVFTSSMARYGKNEIPFTEDMEPKPVDPYGSAKVMEEQIVEQMCELHNIKYNIVIPHNVVGTYQKYNDPFRNVIAMTINSILLGRQPIIYGDGCQTRCYTNIKDIVDLILLLGIDDKYSHQKINMGPDDEIITINELMRIIIEKMKSEIKPRYCQWRPLEIKHAICSSEYARSLLNYQPRISLDLTLNEVIEDIKLRGKREFVYHLPLEILADSTPITWVERLF